MKITFAVKETAKPLSRLTEPEETVQLRPDSLRHRSRTAALIRANDLKGEWSVLSAFCRSALQPDYRLGISRLRVESGPILFEL
jgi:hypothetical protein